MSQNKKNEDALEQPSTYEMKTKPEANSKVFI